MGNEDIVFDTSVLEELSLRIRKTEKGQEILEDALLEVFQNLNQGEALKSLIVLAFDKMNSGSNVKVRKILKEDLRQDKMWESWEGSNFHNKLITSVIRQLPMKVE